MTSPLTPDETDSHKSIVTPAADVDRTYLVALAQLWADQFQHLTTLAVSGLGGLLILLQVELVKPGPRWWVTLGLFALAALLGMSGQAAVVDEATKGVPPSRSVRIVRGLVFAAFGSASYSFVRLFV